MNPISEHPNGPRISQIQRNFTHAYNCKSEHTHPFKTKTFKVNQFMPPPSGHSGLWPKFLKKETTKTDLIYQMYKSQLRIDVKKFEKIGCIDNVIFD